MKKLTILFFTVISAIACKNIQNNKNPEIPRAVTAALQKQYPSAKKVKWDKEEDKYEAEFIFNDKNYSVLYTGQGNLVETEIAISTEALPAMATDYIARQYPGKKIKEAAKITAADGTITYEAEVNKQDVIFDAGGNLTTK